MKRLALFAVLLLTTVVCTGCKEKVVVPMGTSIMHPVLINYNCSAVFVGEKKLQEDLKVKIIKTMECPSGSDAAPREVGLVETAEGDLMWIDMQDLGSES